MSIDFEYIFEAEERFLTQNEKAVALIDSFGTQYTRRQVDELSGRVYGWLQNRGIGKDDFVLIHLERSVKPVIAILGVWKNGSAFTVVETGYAPQRVEFIRRQVGTKIEINDAIWEEIMSTPFLPGYRLPSDHDACVAMYTSGTGGTPKGVVHEYGQLKLEMISEQLPDGTWREDHTTRWALVSPFNFVASIKMLVHFIYCGACIFVLDNTILKNRKKLAEYLLNHRINEVFLSSSLLRLMGNNLGSFIKCVYTGAEPANGIFIKGAQLYNTYTTSESFFTVCKFALDKSYDICPIGKPQFDLDIKLLDEQGNPVEEGQIGELCFPNPYCRGYLDNDSLNEKHFVNGFFHTADLAVYKDGQFVLKGRRDDMIKINGNRIDPSEIEAACRELGGLTQCVAKGFDEEGAVVLYYSDSVKVSAQELRQKLKDRLPYYTTLYFNLYNYQNQGIGN